MHLVFIACNHKPSRFLEDPSFIYRCENLAGAFKAAGHHVSLTHISGFSPALAPDIVVFHRPRMSRKLAALVRALEQRRVRFIADVDDLVFDEAMAEFSPAVRNGILSYQVIQHDFASHRRAFSLFGRITVSTRPLAVHAKRLFPGAKIRVIPNAVHHSWRELPIPGERHPHPTLTYFPGTRSHDRDFMVAAGPLSRLLSKHPEVRLLINGPLEARITARPGQIIHQPKVEFSKFHLLFKSGAVNLSPLEATPFNDCKSALKLIEAGWWGIPTVSSVFPDAERFFDAGALGVKDEGAWEEQIERLITDPAFYEQQVAGARERILERADVFRNAAHELEWLALDDSIRCVQAWGYLPAPMLRLIARRRRTAGRYNLSTLWAFRRRWRKRRSSPALVDYLSFRRDLGYELQPHHARELLRALPRIAKRRLWQACALLREAGTAFAAKEHPDVAPGTGLLTLAPRQGAWRRSFEERLTAARNSGICVVGNSGSLIGSGFGEAIDRSGMVFRFNRYHDDRSRPEDIGRRLDVWVCAPDYRGAAPDKAAWVVVSGPDVCYRRRDWSPLQSRIDSNLPVLTVPLPVWRKLVERLQAPPSAGVLMLEWLFELTGGWDGITAVGIGTGAQGRYHHADPHRGPARRHDWSAEHSLVLEWTGQGLRMLSDKNGSLSSRRELQAGSALESI